MATRVIIQGIPDNPTGVHLHFSIVLDDGKGHFLNELELKNTLDPSAYFQINLNARNNPDEVPLMFINGQEDRLMQMETEHVQPLNGRVALITGAGCGLGRRLARAFAEAGAVIAATDQTPARLMETVQNIQTENGVIKGYLTKPGQVTALVEEVLRDWGRIDILINIPTLPERVNLQDLGDREWRVHSGPEFIRTFLFYAGSQYIYGSAG